MFGGDTQNRTGDKGFADLGLTTWLCRQTHDIYLSCAISALFCNLEATPRIELGIKVLQTSALPLGYVALNGAENEARTRDPHLGKVVLYH